MALSSRGELHVRDSRGGADAMAAPQTGSDRRPSFGTLLRHYRSTAGLTQEALAERAGLSARNIRDLERGGGRRPRRDTVERLATALALQPADQTLFVAAIHQPGAAGADQVAAAEVPASPLIGRVQELERLERHLAGRGPALLLLAGEPGIGKSRLLQAAVARAVGQGLRVLAGGCQRRGGQTPYSPLLEAVQAYLWEVRRTDVRGALAGCAWLVRLLPELAAGPIEPLPSWTLPPAQERRLMFDAVQRFLANVAGPCGTLLVLDDMQWANPDALDLLTALVRAVERLPLRVLGAYRDTEVGSEDPLSILLGDLVPAGLAAQYAIGPLPLAEAEQLLDQLLAGTQHNQPALRAQVAQRTGGVPFFLRSYALALEEDSYMQAQVPWDLTQSIRQRIAALPMAARDVLGVAAVIGRMAPRLLLTMVATHPEQEVLAAVDAASRARLLEEVEGAYRFTHDLIREVTEADLGAVRRAMLHRRIAEALEQGPGEPPLEELAYHYARSDVPEKAPEYLERAGDQAWAQYANAAAERHYRDALERLDDLGRRQDAARVREKYGALLRTMARYDDALPVLERAAETYRAHGSLEDTGRVVAQTAWVHVDRGTPAEGIARVSSVLDLLEGEGPSRSLAALYTALAQLLYFQGRFSDQLAAAERGEHLARMLGDGSILADALQVYGLALYCVGAMAKAVQALEAAIPLAEATGNYYGLSYAHLVASNVYEERGEFETSSRMTERALRIAERYGDQAMAALATTRHGMSAFYMGDWGAARRDYERAVAISRVVGTSWTSLYPLLDLGRLCLAEGMELQASQYLEECERLALASTDSTARGEVESVLAEHDLLERRPEAARARLTSALGQAQLPNKNETYLLPLMAWAPLESGEVSQAAQMVAQAIARSRAEHRQLYLVDALRVQAMVWIRQQEWKQAAQTLQEGLSLARSMRYPYAEARLLHVYGLMHIQKQEPAAAREWLEAALAIFRRLGAREDVERAEQDLANVQ
jgi:tetratricopeptide (TPR) repeat protein/transcriptional regulator with XRE-family HTH domain